MFIPTIGLEIHAELKTKTKVFCFCLNDFDTERPNINVCPVCLGHPGTLPTLNKEAIELMVKIGLALGGEISRDFSFDRKSYFYPDLPKGYQISQYKLPIVKGGTLAGVKIRRVHLEEDTGSLIHDSENGSGSSLVDFNRSGVPLMELVTEPDIKTAEEAVRFAKELRLILRYLNASDADMEKGHMRIEANISLSDDPEKLGTKVEVKNINSFKAVYGAINFEIERQGKILESGGKIAQETRGWDSEKEITEIQRSKESAHDYRYFPEPDIPPLTIDGFDVEAIKRSLPELPGEKIKRFEEKFGIKREEAEILAEDISSADYFEKAVAEFLSAGGKKEGIRLLYNYFSSDLKGIIAERKVGFEGMRMSPANLANLILLIELGKLSSRLAKNILLKMVEEGGRPEEVMEKEGMAVIEDEGELEGVVREIMEKNPKAVEDYKKGKGNALQFLIGQAMGKTKGQANPDKLREVFLKTIDKF